MANEKEITYDVDGYEIITNAILDLLNRYPGLQGDDEIRFAILDLESGKAMFPSMGPVITREVISVTDHVAQECSYSFSVVYRAAALSDNRKISIKEWLDALGRWLEMQTITLQDRNYKLEEYPALTKGREFRRFTRTSPASLYSIQGNQSEDWTINLTAYYFNEFDR